MRKLETYRQKLDATQYPVGREVTYIDPAKTFSQTCKILTYDKGEAILSPIGQKKPL